MPDAAFRAIEVGKDTIHQEIVPGTVIDELMADRASVAGNTRYRELQAEWEQALIEMEEATEEFSAIIKHLHGQTPK